MVGVVEVASKEKCLKIKKRENDRRKIDVSLMNEGVVVGTDVTPWRLSAAAEELVNIAFMEILCV